MGVSTNCIASAMVINQHCLLITRICKFAHIHLRNIIAPASSLSLNPPLLPFTMPISPEGGTRPGLWTLDWAMDWTLDSIIDSIIGLDFRSSGVKGSLAG